jgi:hypothetical protein
MLNEALRFSNKTSLNVTNRPTAKNLRPWLVLPDGQVSSVHLTLNTAYRAPITTQLVMEIRGLLPVISLSSAVGLPKHPGLYQAKLLNS